MSANTSLANPPDEEQVAAATLVCLPGMNPSRLRTLWDAFRGPTGALDAVRRGAAVDALSERTPPSRRDALRQRARDWRGVVYPAAIAALLGRRGTHVWLEHRPGFPIIEDLPDRPPVLLGEGVDPAVFERPRVAVVGTRDATPHGLADARELGAYLASEGVTVVSGLAIGIDGAAHEGAIDAGGGAVGVVATGLDVVYPRRHAVLYERVRATGVLTGETGYGVGPLRSRFPVRNRIIAAFADVVVVVEATARGGARITAQYALEYGRPVLALPGSRRNAAAAGTNALIADGAHPLLEWSDVIVALGLTPGTHRRPEADRRPVPVGDAARVLAALGGEAATPDQLASRTGLAIQEVALALTRLKRDGWLDITRGWAWPR